MTMERFSLIFIVSAFLLYPMYPTYIRLCCIVLCLSSTDVGYYFFTFNLIQHEIKSPCHISNYTYFTSLFTVYKVSIDTGMIYNAFKSLCVSVVLKIRMVAIVALIHVKKQSKLERIGRYSSDEVYA